MNKKTILTIGKSIVLILILLSIVFALRAPAADLNYFEGLQYKATNIGNSQQHKLLRYLKSKPELIRIK